MLAHHFPDVENFGDFTQIREPNVGPIDLLVGGTPCQSFSVAGLRGGLDDDRGNLALEFLKLAKRTRSRWLVWENVRGVLSSNGGRDFGSILGGMVELGYGVFWRILDAQYFGLAQRRKRVFVVGYLGDWRPAAAVLLERESLSRNPAPRREVRKDIAPTISARTKGGGGLGTDFDCDGGLIAETVGALTLNTANGKTQPGDTLQCAMADHMLAFGGNNTRTDAIDASEDGTGRGTPLVASVSLRGREGGGTAELGGDVVPAMRASGGGGDKLHVLQTVAFHENQRGEVTVNDTAGSLKVGGGKPGQGYPAIKSGSSVRRLTPRECERLMGFPDDYTLIPYRNSMAKDGPRYKALGNSMAVPVMRWIGERIDMVNAATLTYEEMK